MNNYRVSLTFTAYVDAEDGAAALRAACEDVKTHYELVDWDAHKLRTGGPPWKASQD